MRGIDNHNRARFGFWMLAALILLYAPHTLAQEPRAHAHPGDPPPGPRAARTVASDLPRKIVVSIPDRKLALIENGRVVKVYPIAIGAPSTPTPSGEFKIVTRIPHPTYYAPGVVIPPGKENPLGTRWMGLSKKSFGIHGTNEPRSIGRRASHGCIRMRNHDAEELFELVRAGDSVELVGTRTSELAQIFGSPQPAAPSVAPAAPVVVAAVTAVTGQ